MDNNDDEFIFNIENIEITEIIFNYPKILLYLSKNYLKLIDLLIEYCSNTNILYIILNIISINSEIKNIINNYFYKNNTETKNNLFCIIFINAAIDNNIKIFTDNWMIQLIKKPYFQKKINFILREIIGKCNIKYIKILLEWGANPNYDTDQYNEIGNILFDIKNLEELKLVKEYGVKFNSIHACGKSALENLTGTLLSNIPKYDYQSKINRYNIVEYYLKNGGIFDINYSKEFFNTIFSCKSFFNLLLNYGFNPNSLLNNYIYNFDVNILCYLILYKENNNDYYYINVLLKKGSIISLETLNILINGNFKYNKNKLKYIKDYLYPDEYII